MVITVLFLIGLIVLSNINIRTDFPLPSDTRIAGINKLAINSETVSDDMSDLTNDFVEFEKSMQSLQMEEEKSLSELAKKLDPVGEEETKPEAEPEENNIPKEEATPSANTRKLNKKSYGKVKIKLFGNTGEKEVTILSENNSFRLESGGVEFETKLPISIDSTSDQLEIETSSGEHSLRMLPEDAISVLRNKKVLNKAEKMELVENSNRNSLDKITIKVRGKKEGNVFGLIPVSANVESEVGGLSGEVLNITQPAWMKFLSPVIQ